MMNLTGRRLRLSLERGLVIAALGGLILLPNSGRAQTTALAQRIADAEAQGKVLSIEPVGDRHLIIDGDLADWGDLTVNSGCIAQGIDDSPDLAGENGKHAAVFKLLSDSEALYIAVHVADASIIPRDPYYNGDCVQLFLDVRPTSGDGPKLGDAAYSDGVYQLMITAPASGSSSVRWMPGGQPSAPIGPFEVAERLLPDGYTVEMRIPFTSLYHMTADRLSDPIGFDIFVDDIDAIGSSERTTPRTEYSWSGSDMTWQDASLMRFAQAGYQSHLSAPFIKVVPGRFVSRTGRRFIMGGLITTRDAKPDDSRIVVTYHGDGGKPEVVAPIEHSETIDYPQLGISVHKYVLDLQSLNRGHYTIETHYPGLPTADATTSFDTLTWRRRSTTASSHRPSEIADMPYSGSKGVRLPNGWRVTPVGHALALPGDLPLRMVFTPDGKYLLANNAGYHDHSVSVIDTASEQIVQSLSVNKTWGGMCLDTKSATLFLSGGGINATKGADGSEKVYPNAILRFSWHGGKLSRLSGLALRNESSMFISGMAAGKNGSLYVVNTPTDTVSRLHAATGAVEASAHVGYRPYALAISPSGKEIAVTNWGDKSVSLLDAASLKETARIQTGSHPDDLVYGKDGRLFVANAGSNSISVILHGRVTETIKTSLDPKALVGSTPDALALSRDETRLYVANAGNNAVAVIDTSEPGESRVLGFIPTGWYPSALGVSPDGKRLFIGTGKGLTFHPSADGTYIGALLQGHVSIVKVPDSRQLAAYTRQVVANVPAPTRAAQRDPQAAATMRSLAGKIKHVLYIIRENRTYDQVFGDVPEGNSDPSLTMFGKEVTPNAHALAHDYVLFDNLYCSGEVSEDGHQWCDAAYATDFTEKAWPNTYSDRGEPDADERLTASPAGYLWDNCARHGLTYFSYGEFVSFKSSPKSPPVYTGIRGLGGHTNFAWSQISFDRHDTERFDLFREDLHKAEKSGKWPRFIVMSLGEDHTQGLDPGKYTPVAHVAANDQALGKIVEAVSHSRFWKETAIFVIEDDAQDGPDHVDAHRTVGLVISPYVQRGMVDSTFYTTASFVHTIEMLLGLPPMTQFDATATPLFRAFMPQPQVVAYRDVPARVDMEARNSSTGSGAVASAGLDFSTYDRVAPAVLNRILWQALKPGVPEPAPVRSALVALAEQKGREGERAKGRIKRLHQ